MYIYVCVCATPIPAAPQEGREHLKEKVRTDRQVGTYLNFDGVVTAEMGGGGGTPTSAAIAGAVEFCIDCIKRGGKHRRFNMRTKRMEFRHVRSQDSRLRNCHIHRCSNTVHRDPIGPGPQPQNQAT